MSDTLREDSGMYFQERIDGTSLSALFVGGGGGSTLLGVTRQIVGREGEPFAYLGSLGPWHVPDQVGKSIASIGRALVEVFGLRGIFGVDLILDPNGCPFPVEVNPRYTASVEVLELATGFPFLAAHRCAFEGGHPGFGRSRSHPPCFVAKAILFADRRSTLPAIHSPRVRPALASTFAVPVVADIPAEGTPFEPGDPVLTVMSRGSTLESCSVRLERRLDRWRGRLSDSDGSKLLRVNRFDPDPPLADEDGSR